MPTPNTRDVREITFIENPMAEMLIRASTTELISETPIMTEARRSPQNSHITTIASRTASITVLYTSEMELSIISLESLITVK